MPHFSLTNYCCFFQDVLNANETQEFEREFFAFRSVIRVSLSFSVVFVYMMCTLFPVKGNCQCNVILYLRTSHFTLEEELSKTINQG